MFILGAPSVCFASGITVFTRSVTPESIWAALHFCYIISTPVGAVITMSFLQRGCPLCTRTGMMTEMATFATRFLEGKWFTKCSSRNKLIWAGGPFAGIDSGTQILKSSPVLGSGNIIPTILSRLFPGLVPHFRWCYNLCFLFSPIFLLRSQQSELLLEV